ncbi:MAG: hypothetical protein K1X61_11715 [Chitinophagales bacterium]|nr:hypothetical protein [Chitinophagales bacterium]
MKYLKLDGFEIYLLQESLKHYKTLIAKEDFPKNSVVTKEYVEMMITQLEEKLSEKSVKEKIRELNAN